MDELGSASARPEPAGLDTGLLRRLAQPLRLANTRAPTATAVVRRVEGMINRLPLVDEMSRRAAPVGQADAPPLPVVHAQPAPPAPPARPLPVPPGPAPVAQAQRVAPPAPSGLAAEPPRPPSRLVGGGAPPAVRAAEARPAVSQPAPPAAGGEGAAGVDLAGRLAQPLRLADTRAPTATAVVRRVEGMINRLPLVDEMSRRAAPVGRADPPPLPVVHAQPAPPARPGPAPAAGPTDQPTRVEARPPTSGGSVQRVAVPPGVGRPVPRLEPAPPSPGASRPPEPWPSAAVPAKASAAPPASPLVQRTAAAASHLMPRVAEPSPLGAGRPLPGAAPAAPPRVQAHPTPAPAPGPAAALPPPPASSATRPPAARPSAELPLPRSAASVGDRPSRGAGPAMEPGIVQRVGEAAPAMSGNAATSTLDTADPTVSTSTTTNGDAREVDIDAVVERVMRKLTRRLAIASERKGLTRWTL